MNSTKTSLCLVFLLSFLFLISPALAATGISLPSSVTPPTSVENGISLNAPWLSNITVNISVNSSDLWQTNEGAMDNVNDIFHSWLSGLAWSVSGHTMDIDLDMNSHNIIEIDKTYFSGSDFISSDDNGHLDIHSNFIDLHGNFSTIWNIHLTDSDGTAAHNNIMLGGGRDAWIYYNSTDLIIDPDVVGDGDVIVLGDIVADNFIGTWNRSGDYVPYTNATQNVNIGEYNITAAVGNFTDLYVSNSSIHIGDSIVLSTDGDVLNITGGNV